MVGHEFSETINDPLIAEANVGPPLAWYDLSYRNGGEIADKCQAAPFTTDGPWTVEQLWSNVDGACVGAETSFSPPVARFTSSGGDSTDQIYFDGSASSSSNSTSASDSGSGQTYSIPGRIATYDWNWGDNTPDGTGATATHTFAPDHAYNVTLTVTDNLGFTASVTQQVIVGSAPPAVSTDAASGVGYQGATLNGTVNPYGESGTYQFVYGTSPGSLSSSTPATPTPAGTAATPVSATIGGLEPSTTYYYRLEVTIAGQVTSGSTQSFTTSPVSQQPTQPPPPTQSQPAPSPPPTQTQTQPATTPASAKASRRFRWPAPGR
jgi:hypothetical protein